MWARPTFSKAAEFWITKRQTGNRYSISDNCLLRTMRFMPALLGGWPRRGRLPAASPTARSPEAADRQDLETVVRIRTRARVEQGLGGHRGDGRGRLDRHRADRGPDPGARRPGLPPCAKAARPSDLGQQGSLVCVQGVWLECRLEDQHGRTNQRPGRGDERPQALFESQVASERVV
jgi:hypothetical protein